MAFRPDQQGSLYDNLGSRKYLTEAERSSFLKAAIACKRDDLKTFCLTLAYTGCRISEALTLTAASIDRTERLVAVRSLKKRSSSIVFRQIPVSDEYLALIERLHGKSIADPKSRIWPWSRGRAWQLVKEVMHDAGIQPGIHATPKGLRHGFGMHAIRCGIPLNLVQRWLGHASMTTTAIYLQAVGKEERDIAARMWSDSAIAPDAIQVCRCPNATARINSRPGRSA